MDTKTTPLNWEASAAASEDQRIMATASGAPRLIAFAGRAGAGKSEASSLLIRRHNFVQSKFAAPLKGMLTAMYEFAGLCPDEIGDRLEGHLKEKPDRVLGGTSPRRAMQTLGGEWGRDSVREDLWVSLWRADAQRKLNAGLSLVVDDLRYPNEADAIRELGGEIWKIEGAARRHVPAHPSEEFDFDPDGVIRNDYSADLICFWNRVLDAVNLP